LPHVLRGCVEQVEPRVTLDEFSNLMDVFHLLIPSWRPVPDRDFAA
jgi:hypothetical protein